MVRGKRANFHYHPLSVSIHKGSQPFVLTKGWLHCFLSFITQKGQRAVGLGVGVSVGVFVTVGVAVSVGVGVTVGVSVTVLVGVTVGVGVAVRVTVGVSVGGTL